MKSLIIALAGISLVSAAGITPSGARKPAPTLTLKDSKGALLRLSKYKGKIVLLNFWATTCAGCKTEIPWFMEFAGKYKHDGLEVIGVSLDEDGWKSVTPFINAKKINYHIVVGNDDIANLFGVEAMPVTLLIDRSGKIAASHVGVVDRTACEGEIVQLLRK